MIHCCGCHVGLVLSKRRVIHRCVVRNVGVGGKSTIAIIIHQHILIIQQMLPDRHPIRLDHVIVLGLRYGPVVVQLLDGRIDLRHFPALVAHDEHPRRCRGGLGPFQFRLAFPLPALLALGPPPRRPRAVAAIAAPHGQGQR